MEEHPDIPAGTNAVCPRCKCLTSSDHVCFDICKLCGQPVEAGDLLLIQCDSATPVNVGIRFVHRDCAAPILSHMGNVELAIGYYVVDDVAFPHATTNIAVKVGTILEIPWPEGLTFSEALRVWRGERIGTCEECGRHFVAPDARQRFCPHPEGSRCGSRARAKRSRYARLPPEPPVAGAEREGPGPGNREGE